MLIERKADLFGPFAKIVAAHGASEGLVLHPLDHGRGLEVEDALGRPHERTGGNKAGQFIARKERVFQARFARHAGVFRVRKNRPRDPLRIALRLQNLDAAIRMILLVGPPLVVEIVQQRDDGPVFLGLAPQPRVPADRRLDRQHVLAQAFALRVFGHQRPCGVSG